MPPWTHQRFITAKRRNTLTFALSPAADPPTEHVDHRPVIPVPQRKFEPAWIRHDLALARRRGRADRHNPDLALAFETLREVRKRKFETDEFGMGVARPWRVRHVKFLGGGHPSR